MSRGQFDDLAAHFMSGPGAASPSNFGGTGGARSGRGPSALGSNAPVTLVVCGNLPNLAGIWVSNFADRIARSTGPVALVRMDPDVIRAEVIRPGGRAIAPGAGWLASVQRFATRWMIGVRECASAGEIVASGKPIDFLTGLDEAALAAAKRRISSLVTAARDAGAIEPRITITPVGGAQEAATATAAGLAAWASKELGVELYCASGLPYVDRIEISGSGEFPQESNLSLAGVIAACLNSSAAPSAPPESEAPQRVPKAAPPKPAAWTAPKLAPPIAAVAQPAPMPAPALAPAAAAAAPDAAEDLASWFEDLTSIAFRPPASPTVTLAVDGAGQLHLLAREASLDALRKARVWAQQHWPLLCAAQPRLAAAAQFVEHILLDRAADGARLHGLGVRLHALVHIRVDGLEVRRRIDLNDETSAG